MKISLIGNSCSIFLCFGLPEKEEEEKEVEWQEEEEEEERYGLSSLPTSDEEEEAEEGVPDSGPALPLNHRVSASFPKLVRFHHRSNWRKLKASDERLKVSLSRAAFKSEGSANMAVCWPLTSFAKNLKQDSLAFSHGQAWISLLDEERVSKMHDARIEDSEK